MRIERHKAGTVVVGAVAAVALFFSGMAVAGGGEPTVVYAKGGSLLQTKIASDVNSWGFKGVPQGWNDVTGAEVTITVPAGQQRLLVGHFSAESQCFPLSEYWCALRIVAKKPGGSIQEFRPRPAGEFAFDGGGGEAYASYAFDRSLKLGAGTWRVWVQANVIGGGGIILDEWHYQVDAHKP